MADAGDKRRRTNENWRRAPMCIRVDSHRALVLLTITVPEPLQSGAFGIAAAATTTTTTTAITTTTTTTGGRNPKASCGAASVDKSKREHTAASAARAAPSQWPPRPALFSAEEDDGTLGGLPPGTRAPSPDTDLARL
eukprot:g72701.t1